MNTSPSARGARLSWCRLLPWMLLLLARPGAAGAEPTPLPRAHAHNDYEHPRPLLDALDHGFGSIEADIWLVDGQLLVAHDAQDVSPKRSLEQLYLDPLRERVRQNGGRVYRGGPVVTLLIDVKSDATNTYRALSRTLAKYRSMLTVFRPGHVETNAVVAILSGNRARGLMEAEPARLAAYDGRLADLDALEKRPAPDLIPLISDNWRSHFRWTGTEGPLAGDELTKLRSLVSRAHRAGARIRFWGMPDTPTVWRTLDEAGVDLINTDQLAELAQFWAGR